MGGSIHRYHIDISSGLLRRNSLSSDTTDKSEENMPSGEVVGLWGFLMPDRGLCIGLLLLHTE